MRYIINSQPKEILHQRLHLEIREWNDIKRLMLLTGEVIKTGRMPSLTSLVIDDCKELRRLSEVGEMCGWEHLTALETLRLDELPELDLEWEEENKNSSSKECKTGEKDNDAAILDTPWIFLAPTLRSLILSKLPKLVKLPRGMQRLTSLHHLQISNCDNLEELPAWINCFTSLQSLKIVECIKLESLPQEMCHLTSLQHLELNLTSEELNKRCQKPSGYDWPKIQHIPNIQINDQRS